METSIQTATFAQAEYDFFWQLIGVNVQYLSIAVAIILGTGILFTLGIYFFNFKPLLKKIAEQEKDLTNLREKIEKESVVNEQKFSTLVSKQEEAFEGATQIIEVEKESNEQKFSTLVSKQEEAFEKLHSEIKETEETSKEDIGKIKKEVLELINRVEIETQKIKVLGAWNQHYVWEAKNVWINVISTLVECIQLSQNFKVHHWIIIMCLEEIEKILKEKKISKIDEKNKVMWDSLKNFEFSETQEIELHKKIKQELRILPTDQS